MKTHISIELSDEQRNALACLKDGKQSKRMIMRKEVVDLCTAHVFGLLGMASDTTGKRTTKPINTMQDSSIYEIDPGDRELMRYPDNPSYVRAWNGYKRSRQAQGVKFD